MNFLALIPVIFQVVQAVENLFPNSPGKEKFDTALKIIEQIYADVEANLPTVTGIINSAVSLLNMTGVFTKKGA